MPKRNAVLMVVLAVAVIAAMGFLVLRPTSAPADDSARIESLLRKLGDPDSDVRREGETGLRALGAAAEGRLREASKSSDRVLADRATRLLQNLQPSPSPNLPGPPDKPGELLGSIPVEDLVFEIVCSGAPENAQRGGMYIVQLTNRGRSPVLVPLPAATNPWRGAWFEVEDDQGRQTRVDAESMMVPDPRGSVVPVGAGSNAILYMGGKSLLGSLFKPESRSVRFVYDASDPGYRAAAEKFGGGALLPSAKLVSKTFILAEAR